MTIVGIDLGTTTGFARLVVNNPLGDSICALSIPLASQKLLSALKRTRGPRALRDYDPRPKYLKAALAQQIQCCPGPIKIYFEDVQFAKSLAQAQLWSSLRGAMWTLDAEFVAVPVQTLKAFAKAAGQSKADMADALKHTLPLARLENADDNQIDAIWLVLYGLSCETHRSNES